MYFKLRSFLFHNKYYYFYNLHYSGICIILEYANVYDHNHNILKINWKVKKYFNVNFLWKTGDKYIMSTIVCKSNNNML